ncbi:alpha/beta fold hydrolase [Virgibacillus byunsanensis]|uniref:Alpha/beta fold hydrolase n=1 Tax=Virgibacillus byunsanensis TaxID=570945 RepID=A0ABW3LK52_9BACI
MYTTINDCNVYYEVHGKDNGETIFFIHGAPGLGDCRADYNAFSDLEKDFKLVFLDMRGSGRSEDKPPYTHEQWAADIDELRNQLGIEKIMIHGGSYGGFLSLEYALRYPNNVSRVLLRDTAANQKFHHLSTKTALEADLPGVDKEMLDRLWEGRVFSDDDMKEIFGAILPLYTVEYNPEKNKERIESIYYHYKTHNYAFSVNQPNYDIEDKLKEIEVPVLVSVGAHDWVTPVECSEVLAKEIPNSKLIVYKNSGHSPHVEENTEYLENVRDFISSTHVQGVNYES